MTRRWLIALSLAAHFALALGLFAAGVWHIEQLPAGRHTTAALAVMTPPAPSGGGALAARKVDVVKKPVHQIVQPVPRPDQLTAVAQATPAATPGDGNGSGAGSGSGTDPDGSGSCLSPPCGIAELPQAAPPPQPPPGPPPPAFVAPTVLRGLRIAGDTQPRPSESTANQIFHDGVTRVTAAFRVCIDTEGAVSSVHLQMSTKYADYDARLAEAVHGWRYQPFRVDGKPVPVCSNVTFIYSAH